MPRKVHSLLPARAPDILTR